MMPLRRWMNEHGHPGWYSWVVVVLSSVTSSVLAIMVSVALATNAVEAREKDRQERERLAAAVEARQEEETRRLICELVVAQDEALDDPAAPPTTEAGRKAAMAWHNLRELFQCDGK
jgi:hypothetical protein